MVRFLLLIAISACGSSAPPADPAFPLPPDNGSATPSPASAGETTAECVPAGVYRVQWDFAAATIRGEGGVDENVCRPMAEGLATQGLAEMTIGHAGSLTIAWPGPQNVIEKSACAFEITSRSPAVATVTFSGGTGNGTASFSLETRNHPGERCDVENATFMLAKKS